MNRTALLFTRQNAQIVNINKDFAAQFPSAKVCFDRANTALGYDLAAICFNGPEAELTKTENAQPGIFLVSWVAFQLLKERVGVQASACPPPDTLKCELQRAPSLKFEVAAGLSLGEFTALTAS